MSNSHRKQLINRLLIEYQDRLKEEKKRLRREKRRRVIDPEKIAEICAEIHFDKIKLDELSSL